MTAVSQPRSASWLRKLETTTGVVNGDGTVTFTRGTVVTQTGADAFATLTEAKRALVVRWLQGKVDSRNGGFHPVPAVTPLVVPANLSWADSLNTVLT